MDERIKVGVLANPTPPDVFLCDWIICAIKQSGAEATNPWIADLKTKQELGENWPELLRKSLDVSDGVIADLRPRTSNSVRLAMEKLSANGRQVMLLSPVNPSYPYENLTFPWLDQELPGNCWRAWYEIDIKKSYQEIAMATLEFTSALKIISSIGQEEFGKLYQLGRKIDVFQPHFQRKKRLPKS